MKGRSGGAEDLDGRTGRAGILAILFECLLMGVRQTFWAHRYR